jgi:acetyltransferase-like isoleucine patch superfamily enzyme
MTADDDYKALLRRLLEDPELEAFVKDVILNRPLVFGLRDRLEISPSAIVNNATFNLSSGDIRVEDYAFFGHEVKLLTGTHDVTRQDLERQSFIPSEGRDITVKRGAWICTGSMILGPCTIGEHAVVAAGSVVNRDVPPFALVGGVPARVIRMLDGKTHE